MKKSALIFFLFSLLAAVISCSDDDSPLPVDDEEEEVISQVVLTFTPEGDGDVVTATWMDADGDGAGAPVIDDIELIEGTEYVLTMTLANTLGEENEDITAEIQAEDDEHMIFFAFTDDIFGDPTGDGNVDNRSDAINYNDEDDNGFPVGLSTSWTAGAVTQSAGEFRIVLKHQPEMKTASSGSTVGGTDLDIKFSLTIQ